MFVHGRSVYDRAQILWWVPGFVLEFDVLRLTLQITEIARHGLSIFTLWRESLQIGSFSGITLEMVETIRLSLAADKLEALELSSKEIQSVETSAHFGSSESLQTAEEGSASAETKESGDENFEL